MTVTVCTGISKCEKLSYFKKVKKFSEELKKKGKGPEKNIKIYSVGDIMMESMKRNHNIKVNDHILNKDKDVLSLAAGEAIRTIKNDIDRREKKGEYNHNIISTHTGFVWKGTWSDSYNEMFLDILEPDLFITILDHEKRIQERQYKDKQWKTQELSLDIIALWQDKETQNTDKWARKFGKRHLVFGRNQSPETLFKMINYPDAPIFYSNFPMTWLQKPKESYELISLNNYEMEKYGSVIDPRTIEIMQDGEGDSSYSEKEQQILEILLNPNKKRFTKAERIMLEILKEKEEHEKRIIKYTTTHRDLNYYVSKVDVDVLYFPEFVPSFGGVAEILKAHRSSIDTYLILPDEFKSKEVGPFERFHSLEIFFGVEEFHRFLARKYRKLDMYK